MLQIIAVISSSSSTAVLFFKNSLNSRDSILDLSDIENSELLLYFVIVL
jgi:hypothetical protein